MLPTLLPKQRVRAVAVAVGFLYTLFLIYFSIVMARDWSRKDPLTIASWAVYGLLGDSSVFAIGPVSVMVATNCARDGLENMAPAAAAVCCGLVCAVIYPVLAASDAVWGAVCISTLVKALLIAVGFFMIPAYRTPAQKMEMERLRAEGAVPAELQALMQLGADEGPAARRLELGSIQSINPRCTGTRRALAQRTWRGRRASAHR